MGTMELRLSQLDCDLGRHAIFDKVRSVCTVMLDGDFTVD